MFRQQVALSFVVILESLVFVDSMAIENCRPADLSGSSDVAIPTAFPNSKKGKYNADRYVFENAKQSSSVILPNHDLTSGIDAWSPHVPGWKKLFWNAPKSVDCKARWKGKENYIQVAEKVSCDIRHWFEGQSIATNNKSNTEKTACRLADIISSMEKFMEYCDTHLEKDTIVGYNIRISDLQGSLATQCPAFHADNVPVRWIQTLFGPGTVYLDPQEHSYNGPLGNIVTNTPPKKEMGGSLGWKEELVKSLDIVPSQAPTGKAALLIGRRWLEVAKQEYLPRECVLHRSPKGVGKTQGRVVLVLDVDFRPRVNERLGSNECTKGCC